MMFLKAFIVGGLICLGVLLGAFGVYDKLVDFAGAGATVPLTGFGNSLANGVKDSVRQSGFLGVITGGLSACSAGVTVALLSALLVSVFTRSKDK